MIDTDTMRRVLLDVASDRHPGAGYTPEMTALWHRTRAEFDEWQKIHPGATLWIPPDLPE